MNAEVFKQRYYPFHPKLYRIAYALLNDATDAEDVLQDAYCKLWTKRNELITIQQPEAYCVTLVRNLCLSLLRSPRNRKNYEEVTFLNMTAETTPEQELESKERVRGIQSLIGRLPEKQRIVIQMRGCDDCTLEEIGLATGESAVHVRVLLSRARKALREMLNK